MRIIDLSREVYDGFPKLFPGPSVTIFELDPFKGPGFEGQDFAILMSDHTGTHVDAPRHFDRKGEGIDKIPLERFIKEAVVLDLTHKKAESLITTKDLKDALKKSGERIDPGDVVLLHTGWGKKGETKEYSKNPGISEDGARWLLEKEVSMVGIDGLSIDNPNTRFPGHTFLLRDHKILHLENLCDLDKIKKSRVVFIAFPLKLRGATGSPVRAVAIEGLSLKGG